MFKYAVPLIRPFIVFAANTLAIRIAWNTCLEALAVFLETL
jgi:hypothetical protein